MKFINDDDFRKTDDDDEEEKNATYRCEPLDLSFSSASDSEIQENIFAKDSNLLAKSGVLSPGTATALDL